MTAFAQTVLEVVNHALTRHPELTDPVARLCASLKGTRDEFEANARQWFADQGDRTLRLDYPLDADSVVFDLGGYHGDFAWEIHQRYGCRVYVFEPSRRFHQVCSERFAGNPKVVCLNYGLSDAEGSIAISDEDNGSSTIKNNQSEQCEVVALKAFRDVVEALGVGVIDLLKINVEGAEFQILPHIIASGLLPRIRHLQIQFHTFYPNSWKLRDQIRLQLAETHREAWNYPFVWESWQRKA